MKITFTISNQALQDAYEKVVTRAVQNTAIKGFRQGKAPKEKVIASVGQSILQQQAVEEALPQAYIAEVKKQKITPVSYPNIQLVKGTWGDEFEFEAEIAETPKVDLGDYKEKLKGTLAAAAIWTPEQGEKPEEKKELTREAKTDKVLRQLLETIKVNVPKLLVDREVNRRLSELLEQLNKLGLKIDDYLVSTKQTKESLREQYEVEVNQSLALEFILMEVVQDLKIEVSNEEIEEILKSVGDKNTRERLRKPEEKANLYVMLSKQKAIEKLLQLAA